MAYKFSENPFTNEIKMDKILQHELTHIQQMETLGQPERYAFLRKIVGYQENPYEIEARNRENKFIPFHRVGKYDILHQKELEKRQKKDPEMFKIWAGWEKDMSKIAKRTKQEQKEEQSKQSRLARALEKIRTTLE